MKRVGFADKSVGRRRELTHAEDELIALLRNENGVTGFSVTVRLLDSGRYVVSQSNDTPSSKSPEVGGGRTFDEAWRNAGAFTGSATRKSIALTMDGRILRALDTWISKHPESETMTRGEAARLALSDWLKELGLLEYNEFPEGTH